MRPAELASLTALVYIAWELRLYCRVTKALVTELSTYRWERGVRDGLAQEALDKLARRERDD